MMIYFVVDSSDLLKVLSGKENENFIVLKRADGFFKNRDFIKAHFKEDINIYTDDETMLDYSSYDFENKKWNVFIKFPDFPYFIKINIIYPNLRATNSLVKLYHGGMIHNYYKEWKDSMDAEAKRIAESFTKDINKAFKETIKKYAK